MAASDARLFPLKNTAYRVTFPILDADGDLVTGAAGLDSEVSLDGGTFADCTNEATEIATSSGVYYLDLTAAEMNADTVAIIVKTSTSGAKTTTLVMYPVETGDIDVDVTAIAGTAINTAVAQIGCNVVSQANIDFGALQKTSLNAATPASIQGDTKQTGDAYAEAVLIHAHAQTIETDVAAVHVHANTIDGHITADYGATEKAAIDLLDDANGLINIHDTVDLVHTDVDAILADTGTDGVVLKAAGLDADAVDEILDEVIEGTITLRQALRIFLATLAGKSTGGGTATLTFKDNADTKARVTATVDANGNRTAITLDGA